eukprot:TRINITY_DN59948_c0_g2_i9.p2 TRINITY_DN59948_c0_g2~~TRINITY_DN59948_c0_g2_i9.p2  ORF type:complete len:240 (+),score=-5.01 TRINITY_DN59948_c0_g2_i9:252-971(+)
MYPIVTQYDTHTYKCTKICQQNLTMKKCHMCFKHATLIQKIKSSSIFFHEFSKITPKQSKHPRDLIFQKIRNQQDQEMNICSFLVTPNKKKLRGKMQHQENDGHYVNQLYFLIYCRTTSFSLINDNKRTNTPLLKRNVLTQQEFVNIIVSKKLEKQDQCLQTKKEQYNKKDRLLLLFKQFYQRHLVFHLLKQTLFVSTSRLQQNTKFIIVHKFLQNATQPNITNTSNYLLQNPSYQNSF